MSDASIVITGADRIEGARVLAVRAALKLETLGMRRTGRSARILANEITGSKARSAVAAYEALNAHIVKTYGETFNRPLAGGRQHAPGV